MAPEGPPAGSIGSSTATTIQPTKLSHRERPTIDKVLLDQYVTRDWVHSEALVNQRDREKTILDRKVHELEDYRSIRTTYRTWFPPQQLYGLGYNGYGNGHTEGKPGLLYPNDKPRVGRRRTQVLRVKRKDLTQQAEQVEELVPVRLDVDWDKIKLRDTFTWNLHDRVVPVKLFAEQLIEDFKLESPASDRVLEQIVQQMYEQIGDFFPPVYFEEDALDPELPYSAYKNDEMRILIKLNITIGPHTLVDQFEWEINNPLNSPEEFAQCMARDLSLSGEFATSIAHCIREQSQLFTRSLYIVGHPFDGRPIEEQELAAAFQPSPLSSAFRPQQQAKDFAPYLYELNELDLERNEVIFSREQRRQKRSVNRRGGPILPDLKERQRTVRTLVVSSVLPGAAYNIDESRIYKRVVGIGRSKKGIGGQKDGLEVSDSEESEHSGPESPALSQLQGTARTRNMRGAANAAQQRMSNLGRSETPEAVLHHHETRTSARRFGGRDGADDNGDGIPTLMVRLKIGKEKLRQYLRDRKASNKSQGPSSSLHHRSQSATSNNDTSPATGTMGPPTTPGPSSQQLNPSLATSSKAQAALLGRVAAPHPQSSGQPQAVPPPPPTWLSEGLDSLRATYPEDRFEGIMKYSMLDTRTDTLLAIPTVGTQIPPYMSFAYVPRIRCHDCPGKLYTPGPGNTVENFEVHLKNRLHREKVDARTARERTSV